MLPADEYRALSEAIWQVETLLRIVKDKSRRAELVAVLEVMTSMRQSMLLTVPPR